MRALGIILAGGKNERLKELNHNRALAAMPMAGSYRAVDFSLSNMTNSGIHRVAVVTQYNSRSLVEHLSSSKWWDFGRKHGGLYVFTPFITHDNSLWYRGTSDAIYQNIDYLKDAHEPYVVIAQGDSICKIDFNELLEYHINTRADITVVCKRVEDEDLSRYGHVSIDEDLRVTNFEEKPIEPVDNLVSTGMYIIRRRLLIELVEGADLEGRYDFVNDILIRYRKQKNIMAYEHKGHWRSISSLESYFKGNMEFLQKDLRDKFFKEYPSILSKVEDEPPAKFNQGSNISNTLCSSGCIINGYLKDSMLFRRVFIGKNSVVKNSIILEGTYIGDNCVIENCIIDSRSTISDGSVLKSESSEPRIVVNREQIFF